MVNLLRADVYRLIRGKGIWLVQVVVFLMALIKVASGSRLSGGYDGAKAVSMMYSDGNLIFYMLYILSLFLLILSVDFTQNELKNVITSGITRVSYYLSKIVSFSAALFLLIVESYLLPFLGGLLLGGLGDFDLSLMRNIGSQWLGLWLNFAAIAVIGYLALYVTKNAAASVLVAVFIPLFIYLMHSLFVGVGLFNFIDFFKNMLSLTSAAAFASKAALHGLIGASLVIAAGIFGSVKYFEKMDV